MPTDTATFAAAAAVVFGGLGAYTARLLLRRRRLAQRLVELERAAASPKKGDGEAPVRA